MPPPLSSAQPASEGLPDLLVKVGGVDLPAPLAASVIDASVTQRVGGEASSLTLHIAAWDPDRNQLAWVDDDSLVPGREVEVQMGYQGALAPVFHGEIVGYELEIAGGQRPVLTVNAYDLLHRLGRGQRNRPPPQQEASYADLLREIARDYSLGVDAQDGDADPRNSNVTQEARSDLEFLTGLAQQIGYELYAVDRTLTFRAAPAGDPPRLTLDANLDLVTFSGTLAANNQYGSVEIRSRDTERKQIIVATADNPDSTDDAFGPSATRIVDYGITTQVQAHVRAEAELARMRSGYIAATGTCFGRPDLAAGMVVEIVNIGTRFGGRFYVTSATHLLSHAEGYRTSFTLTGEPR